MTRGKRWGATSRKAGRPFTLYHHTTPEGWDGIRSEGCIRPSDPRLTREGGVGTPVVWLTTAPEPLLEGPSVRLRIDNVRSFPWGEWASGQPEADPEHLLFHANVTPRIESVRVHPGPIPLGRVVSASPVAGGHPHGGAL